MILVILFRAVFSYENSNNSPPFEIRRLLGVPPTRLDKLLFLMLSLMSLATWSKLELCLKATTDGRGDDRVQQFPLHRGPNNFQAKHLDLQADRMVDLCRFPDYEFLDKLAITVKN